MARAAQSANLSSVPRQFTSSNQIGSEVGLAPKKFLLCTVVTSIKNNYPIATVTIV